MKQPAKTARLGCLVFALAALVSMRVCPADDSSGVGLAASALSVPEVSDKTVPATPALKDGVSSVAAPSPSAPASVAKTDSAVAVQAPAPSEDVKSDAQLKDLETQLAAAQKILADQQAQTKQAGSKQDQDDAERTSREELAQAQAMADATIAAQSAATAAATASSSDETALEQAIGGGAETSSAPAATAAGTDSHYSMTSLVDRPHGLGINPSDAGHHSLGEVADAGALAPDASDTKHHSMGELIDNP